MSGILQLVRFAYAPEYTSGRLFLPDGRIFYTIERPWIHADTPGGLPSSSCVPEGLYRLERHNSPEHPGSWALVNEELGVYHLPSEVPAAGGRSVILIHPGNTAKDVEGCIAVGMGWAPGRVNDSRTAYGRMRASLERAAEEATLSIEVRQISGARD
jgi:hypothetical protein